MIFNIFIMPDNKKWSKLLRKRYSEMDEIEINNEYVYSQANLEMLSSWPIVVPVIGLFYSLRHYEKVMDMMGYIMLVFIIVIYLPCKKKYSMQKNMIEVIRKENEAAKKCYKTWDVE